MFVRGIEEVRVGFMKKPLRSHKKKRIDHALFIVKLEGSGYLKNSI